ncbi:MAG: CidA/LrgA family protein [Spirochaetales bacterium]|nr:CidA/LrgA family protein [Spirochaetales bacterium]
MKYLKQLLIIFSISFLGEILSHYIPLGIPASIYGMVIMFTLLCTGVLKLESVREVGKFLVGIMGIMFVPATVGIIDCWDVFSRNLWLYLIVIMVTTIIVMSVSALVTQSLGKLKKVPKVKNDA